MNDSKKLTLNPNPIHQYDFNSNSSNIPISIKSSYCKQLFDSEFKELTLKNSNNNLSLNLINGFRLLNEINLQNSSLNLISIIPNLNNTIIINLLKTFKFEKKKLIELNGFPIFCKLLLLKIGKDKFIIYNYLSKNLIFDPLNQNLIQLISLDSIIFENFIYFIIDNITFNNNYNKINPENAINIISIFLIHSYDNFLNNIELVDYIIESLHNLILNSISKTDDLISKTLNLFIEFLNLTYIQKNIITCSNIDKILQFHISIEKLNIENYIKTFNNKDLLWIENSLLSLEFILFPNLTDNISFTSKSNQINWNSIILYLNLFSSIMNQSINKPNLSSKILRPLFNLLLKLFKIIDIPSNHDLNFKLYSLNILSISYKWNLPPFDHIKFFNIILSFISFSNNLKIRESSFNCLNSILDWDKENLIPKLLNIKNSSNFKLIIKDSISFYKIENDYLNIIKNIFLNLNSKFINFNFIEFFNIFIKFENINLIKFYKNSILSYPKILKLEIINQLKNLSIDSNLLQYFSIILKDSQSFDELKILKLNSIPLYPGSNKKEIRMYLFSLLLFKKNRNLDSNDYMICDMFRFEDFDIINSFIEIFNTFSIPNQILNEIINCLSKQNLILLSIVEKSKNLNYLISLSINKFKLIKPCIIGDSKKFIIFLNFFIDLIHGNKLNLNNDSNLNDDLIIEYLLKHIELSYLEWELIDKLSFWDEFMKISIDSNQFDKFINNMNHFLRHLSLNKNYVLVNKNIIIPLNSNDVENLSNDELNLLISEKINNFKNLKSNQLKEKLDLNNNNIDKKKKKKQQQKFEEIHKTQNIQNDLSNNDFNISIIIYPNGKIINEDLDDNKINSKKLTAIERKELFLKNSSANNKIKVEIKGNQSFVITKYSDHIIKLIINDIFKGVFQNKINIGKMVGILFNSNYNFAFASDIEILQTLEKFKLNNNDFSNYLFIKLSFYLNSRELLSSLLKKNLNILKSTRKRMLLFIDEESKI